MHKKCSRTANNAASLARTSLRAIRLGMLTVKFVWLRQKCSRYSSPLGILWNDQSCIVYTVEETYICLYLCIHKLSFLFLYISISIVILYILYNLLYCNMFICYVHFLFKNCKLNLLFSCVLLTVFFILQ